MTGFAVTARRDAWWLQPLVVFLALGTFVAYATWAAFQGAHYHFGPYLSPFYSPEVFGESTRSWFGPEPGWWPTWLPWSPAFLILWAPGGFRLILQNVHRYFLYVALFFLCFLSYDVWRALWFTDPATGSVSIGVGVGTLVLATNVVLLGGYTLGCHSLRHLVGGALDQLAGRPVRRAAYGCVSCLNRRHMLWAWMSLCWVAFSDLYVRLCAMGVWTDWRIL